MFKNNLIHVGTFGKPLGLKGEINIYMLTHDINSFKKLSPFFSDEGYFSLGFSTFKNT